MELPLPLIIGAGTVGIVFLLVLLALHFYVVVEPNKAHVVVTMGGGRKIYHPARPDSKSAYFYIPFLMQRIIVSLENVKHEINEIELKDLNVAPFKCDITCWFRIENPELAAEKLDVDSEGNIMQSITETLNAQIQGVARSAAMGQEVIDLMRNRQGFGADVFTQVNGDLDEWGVQLVKLEIIDFKDVQGSQVIKDYETRREATVAAETRKIVAEQDKEAKVVEAESKKIAEKARIESEQEIEMRGIEKKEKVGIREESQRLRVAEEQDKANARKVAADRTLTVGEAEYQAEAKEIVADGEAKAAVKLADGQAQAIKLDAAAKADATTKQGEADADVTTKLGKANASVIAERGRAEAEAIDKKADAQKKFQDASKEIELAKIAAEVLKNRDVQKAEAVKNADVRIVSEDMQFMGFGAKDGAGLGELVNVLQESSGVDVKGAVNKVVDTVANTAKKVVNQ